MTTTPISSASSAANDTAPKLPAAPKPDLQRALLEWLPIVLGLLAIYIPTVTDLMKGLWSTDDQAHGPIILAIVLYLLWEKQEVFVQPLGEQKPSLLFGSLVLLFGMLMYILGRSQTINILEIGAMIPLVGGAVLLTRGWSALRKIWFALLFMIFMVPLPGILVDAATGPLKQYISVIAENVLYQIGYPIGRSGVTIVIGQYQLMVADACSGLHSMFSLSAIGILYLHLMQYRNMPRVALIVASILPIAFAANVVRVMILILVTYHFGDEAGQGIIHGAAGMLLYVISLVLLFVYDGILGRFRLFQDKPKQLKEAN